MVTIDIDRFDSGVTNDPRDPRASASQMVSNFDVFTNPRKITPYVSAEDGDSSASTSKKQNFAVALRTGSTYSLYALGVKSATDTAEVLYKNFTTSSADLSDATWTAPSANQSSSGTTQFGLFTYYAKTNLIYGARASRYIWAFSPSGTAWADTSKDLNDYSDVFSTTFTNIAEGIVHSKDDILYVGVDNWVIANDNGTWTAGTAPALTLPSHLYITSMCEYGNYLAIGCAPLSGVGNSVVYLWDRDSTLTTVTESIDWGDGDLKVLETVEGKLIGVSIAARIAGFAGGPVSRFNNRVIFRFYSIGGGAKKFSELTSSATTNLQLAKQRIDNRLYFLLDTTLGGTRREGLWSVGISGETFAISNERTPNNDTDVTTTNGSLINFFVVGDYAFIAYINSSSAYAVSKTDNGQTYTATSVYETVINPGMDVGHKNKKKQLVSVQVSYEPLPAAGQVVLKYKVDGSAYTTIFTETTDSVLFTESVKDSSGDVFTSGREYEFRIESTGAAVITGIKYKYELLETLI
jgi:hypothetical protein